MYKSKRDDEIDNKKSLCQIRVERSSSWQILIVKRVILAPSTPKKKHPEPTTKPFSNTTNPSPNSTFHHKQQMTKSKSKKNQKTIKSHPTHNGYKTSYCEVNIEYTKNNTTYN